MGVDEVLVACELAAAVLDVEVAPARGFVVLDPAPAPPPVALQPHQSIAAKIVIG
jgi:hypothetical protein